MAEFYDKDCMKRHESPTTRLIDQKNSKFMHAQALNQIQTSQDYVLKYTSKPGKSFMIEPQKLDYKVAYRDPVKFYETVMEQNVTEHKVKGEGHRQEVISKVTPRKIGKILRQVQGKLAELMELKDDEDLQLALQDSGVQRVMQKHVDNRNILLDDGDGNDVDVVVSGLCLIIFFQVVDQKALEEVQSTVHNYLSYARN